MSTRSGRIRQSLIETSPPRTRKGVSPTRSPARNRKSSPILRSGQRSPSRKSPSRKSTSKYPARKSPSRAVKEKIEKEEKDTTKDTSASKSPAKRPALKKEAQIRLQDFNSEIEVLRSTITRSRRLEYSIKDIPSTLATTELLIDEKPNGLDTVQSLTDIYGLRNRKTFEDIAPRRSSRLRDVVESVPDIRRSFSKSLSKSVSKSISKSIDTYSDEENENSEASLPKEKSQSVTRKLATPLPSSNLLSYLNNRYEFGGRIGSTALFILIPFTVFSILIACTDSCSYKSLLELKSYKPVSKWFNTTASVAVISHFILQAIFLALPIFGARQVDEQGKKYYFNATFSAVCSIILLSTLDYYKIVNINIILSSYLQMATVSYLIGVLFAIIIYWKSQKVEKDSLNPYGHSGYHLYDLFMGRQLHEYILKINVKLYLARVSNISSLIFAVLIFKQGFILEAKDINDISWDGLTDIINKTQYKPIILIYSMMQIIYALYFITREKKIISTFYWQSEGLGYMQIVSSFLYPFYFTTVSKYVADVGINVSTNILIGALSIYLMGLIIMVISNNIKYEFRKNPLQASLTHLDSMPTFHGKRLLVSNLWGIVRHPNYTGDIMIHIALALPGIVTQNVMAAAPALLTILILLHRIWRDHNRCRRRYGAAWQRYCKKVPGVIIPKVL